jgi:hypothetical protein
VIDLADPSTDIKRILRIYKNFRLKKLLYGHNVFNLHGLTNWVYDYFEYRDISHRDITKAEAWAEAEETANRLLAAWKMAKLVEKELGYQYYRFIKQ